MLWVNDDTLRRFSLPGGFHGDGGESREDKVNEAELVQLLPHKRLPALHRACIVHMYM